ncbi:MAG: heme NO-binding domain-containing protein [Pseudomonadales bacterium]|nr:heme NO-binding domain-containing protein [Pseudomonadales bacterium]
MKGVVFNILADMVESSYGIEAWDGLLLATGLEGVYVATESYPDEELYALVEAASKATGIEASALVPAFGRYMMPAFVEQYPMFFPEGQTLKQFLLTVDAVVHKEVRKLFPDAGLPEFRYRDDRPDALTMVYRSPRRLCALAEGLVQGAADHFGERCRIAHDVCMHRGADRCELEMEFNAA